MYQRILVPIDGSQAATLGMNEAIKLAREQGSRVRFVHVVDEALVVSPDAAGTNLGDVVGAMRERGEQLLAQAASAASTAGVDADTMLVEAIGGRAGPYILQQSTAWPADLIVCGTHGRRGVRRLLLGSDAEYIVRHASVPVLLLREPGAERT